MSALATSPAITWATAAAAALCPRVDLRTGVLAGGFVTGADGLDLADWTDLVTRALARWRAEGRTQPIAAAAPAYLFEPGTAAHLDALLRGADVPMRAVTVEIEETELAAAEAAGLRAAEKLRARGWGVALRCAEDCPLPLGGRSRSLFSEIVCQTPADLSPALALADPDLRPVTRRIRAAKEAGLATTALGVASPAQAGLLAALGFDRGQGPGYPI